MADGLVAALARCQAKFPPIVKSHTNPAFKGSQYADVADVLAAVRPVLAAEGLAVSQYTEIDAETGGVALITTLMYSLDEGMSSRFPLYVSGLTDQQVGSKLTYHRRYQLCALLGVHPVGDDDDGNLAATAQTYSRRSNETAPSVVPQPEAPTKLEPGRVMLPDAKLAISQPDKPLAAMTMRELLAFATENAVSVSGSKSDIVRTLEPLVRAASGEEPFELDGAVPLPVKEDVTDKPFTPTVADELRNRPPAVRDSIRSGGDA